MQEIFKNSKILCYSAVKWAGVTWYGQAQKKNSLAFLWYDRMGLEAPEPSHKHVCWRWLRLCCRPITQTRFFDFIEKLPESVWGVVTALCVFLWYLNYLLEVCNQNFCHFYRNKALFLMNPPCICCAVMSPFKGTVQTKCKFASFERLPR